MNLKKIKKIVKNILAIKSVRKTVNLYNYHLYKLLSKNKFLALSYHFIISHYFDREIFSFTKAVYKYNVNLSKINNSNVVIRRNIHRLEKGLIMKNLRPLFALDYIEETIESYALIIGNCKKDELASPELKWALDVLTEYFKVVDNSHPLIIKLKNKFEKLPKPRKENGGKEFKPYESKDRSSLKIPTYESFLNLSLKRRSVRWYKNKKVSRLDVDKAIAAAALAPSACNRQPFKYFIFDDTKLTKEIANIPFGTGGYANNIPMIIVIVGDMSNYFSSRDRHTIYIDASLSAMAFMYGLETLGLSSVAINWPDFGLLENKMKKKLNLEQHERPVMMMAIGYAEDEGKIPYSQKKPIDQLRSYNELAH